jgi:hypothetical protein
MTRATRAALIKFAVVAGAADSSTAGISVAAEDGTAITTNDIIIACVELAQTSNAKTDRTAASAIIAGGKITVPASANDTILVWWMARDAGQQVSSPYIRAEIAAGGSADTNMAIAGIATSDLLICVASIHSTTGAWTDRTANSSITSAGNVQCDESTTGEYIFVVWMDLSGPRSFSALNLQFALANIDTSPSTDPSSATVSGLKSEDTLQVVLCLDETDGDVLDELTAVSSCTVDGTLTVDEPSPTASSGAELFVFWQKANDLDT